MAVRRPVVRLWIASSRTSWSLVGGWTTSAKPLNATIPIWVVDPWRRTNALAACSAASSRVGSMSVEHMLPETSIARITVVLLAGTLTIATGRARATTSPPRATTNRANGRWRRRRDERGSASRTRARLEYRAPDGRRRRRLQT